MKEQLKGLARRFLPLAFASSMLVIFFGGLSQAMDAGPTASFTEMTEERSPAMFLLGYQTGVSTCQQTQNLVHNPGFEHDIGCQHHWCDAGDCIFTWDETEHDGHRSARIFAGSTEHDKCFLFIPNDEMISVEHDEDRFYDYSAWVKTDLLQGDAYLRINFWDDQGYRGNAYTERVTDTHGDWVKVTGSVRVPAGIERARVEATLSDSSIGSVWFDDVFFGLATCLDISKSDDPDPVAPGEMLNYTIAYSNTGRETATNVEIIETFDSYVDFRSAQPAPDGGHTVWEIAELLPGTGGAITVVVQVDDDIGEATSLSNSVEIVSDETQTNPVSVTIATDLFTLLTGVDDVAIAGPQEGVVQADYAFTASVSPVTATLPITYVWQATGHPVMTNTSDSPNDTITLNWSTAGTQIITVTATNAGGTASSVHTITIAAVPLQSASVAGPTTGDIHIPYVFTATVGPAEAALPITYTWDAGDQVPITHVLDSFTDIVAFTWAEPGAYDVTMTAQNPGSAANDTHTITIEVPAEDIDIVGPTTGNVHTDYTFTATVSPPTATRPFDYYTWSPTPKMGQGTAIATFNWPSSGLKTIAVTAVNVDGVFSDIHTVAIEVPQVGPGQVSIDGPSTADARTPVAFTATVSPPTATLPFTYRWRATEQDDDVVAISDALSHTVTFDWQDIGPQTVIVTVTNAGGIVTDTHHVVIFSPAPHPSKLYFPLVLRKMGIEGRLKLYCPLVLRKIGIEERPTFTQRVRWRPAP